MKARVGQVTGALGVGWRLCYAIARSGAVAFEFLEGESMKSVEIDRRKRLAEQPNTGHNRLQEEAAR